MVDLLEQHREFARQQREACAVTARDAMRRGALYELSQQVCRDANVHLKIRLSREVYQITAGSAEFRQASSRNMRARKRAIRLLHELQHAIEVAGDDAHDVTFTCPMGRQTLRCYAYVDSSSGLAVHVMTADEAAG